MKKRGISPLIATVLLVGFVIAMAVLVWLWYGNIIEERAQKVREDTTGKFSCASDVSISVVNLGCDSDNAWVNFDVQNTGQADLVGFRVFTEGSTGTDTHELPQTLARSGTITAGVRVTNPVGVMSRVTIMPVITSGSSSTTCTGQQVILSCLS